MWLTAVVYLLEASGWCDTSLGNAGFAVLSRSYMYERALPPSSVWGKPAAVSCNEHVGGRANNFHLPVKATRRSMTKNGNEGPYNTAQQHHE